MVHFNRFYLSYNADWIKGDHHAEFGLHLAHRDSTSISITNFVDILEESTGVPVNELVEESRASGGVVPLVLSSLQENFHLLNQIIFVLASNMFSPLQPEIGTNATMGCSQYSQCEC